MVDPISSVTERPENLDSIFFNVANRSDCSIQIFAGTRGRGKTYSALRSLVYDTATNEPKINESKYSGKFIYMRNMQSQIDLCCDLAGNPFKAINRDYGLDITPRRINKVCRFYAHELDKRETYLNAEPIGYGMALNTFSNVRGVDLSDVDTIVFDEFIDQSQRIRKLTKTAGNDFQNMRETIGRNRELFGERKPLRIYMLSNSVSLNSPILLELGVVQNIANMIKNGQSRCTIREKDIYIEIIEKGVYESLKAGTTLYRGAEKDTVFYRQALENEFTDMDTSHIRKKVPINEYIPLFTVAHAFTFYQHKSRQEFFVSSKMITSAARENYTSLTLERCGYYWKNTVRLLHIEDKIWYDAYATRLVFESIFEF